MDGKNTPTGGSGGESKSVITDSSTSAPNTKNEEKLLQQRQSHLEQEMNMHQDEKGSGGDNHQQQLRTLLNYEKGGKPQGSNPNGNNFMESINQLPLQQQSRPKQKGNNIASGLPSSLSSPMRNESLQHILNQKQQNKDSKHYSHTAIEQLQENLRQAQAQIQEAQIQQARVQQAMLSPQSEVQQTNDTQQQHRANVSRISGPSDSPTTNTQVPNNDPSANDDVHTISIVSGKVDNYSDTAKIQRSKVACQQQRHLFLLYHASKCTAGANCKTQFCAQKVMLWKHMKKCRNKSCTTAHCLSSRRLLNHYRICRNESRTATCEICAPVMKQIRLQSEQSREQVVHRV